jgi:UDP-N-acetylmuramate--alanine ligase
LVSTFVEVCRAKDLLFILPVYDAGGTADRTIQSDDLVALLRDRKIAASYSSDVSQLVDEICNKSNSGDVVIVMGARDPFLPELARKILEARKNIT